jgi:ribonucleoside-triphosphate reductase
MATFQRATLLPYLRCRTENYSRITGYYRPVQYWNDGKAQEFKERKLYDIDNSVLKAKGDFSNCRSLAK